MALTPHARDPKRKEILGDMKALAEGNSEAKGTLKQNWNADKAPNKVVGPEDDKPAEEAEAAAAEEADKAGKKGK